MNHNGSHLYIQCIKCIRNIFWMQFVHFFDLILWKNICRAQLQYAKCIVYFPNNCNSKWTLIETFTKSLHFFKASKDRHLTMNLSYVSSNLYDWRNNCILYSYKSKIHRNSRIFMFLLYFCSSLLPPHPSSLSVLLSESFSRQNYPQFWVDRFSSSNAIFHF